MKQSYNAVFDYTDFVQTIEASRTLPEANLMVAVLQRAILDYFDPASKAHVRADARAYLYSDSQEVMSFRWICEVVSDFPDELHGRIMAYLDSHERKPKVILFRVDTR